MLEALASKICSKCFRELPATREYFSPQINGLYMLYSRCKTCMAAISKTQRDTHPENYQTIQTKYCNSHKQEILDRSRAYKQANPIKVKQWKAKSNNLKLISIKLQKCICPGCGIDFSMCNDLGLLMIFEKSHIHNKVCQLRNDKEFFWSCRICNVGKQSDKCGFWEAPLIFKELL